MDIPFYIAGFKVASRHIYFGWQSVDLPASSIVKVHENIIHADSPGRCLLAIREAFPDSVFDSTIFFDLDDIGLRLAEGRPVEADDIINLWNMLTDIRNAMRPEAENTGELFMPEAMAVYDRFFSRTSAGGLVGLDAAPLGPDDDVVALQVVERGADLLKHLDD